MLHSCGRASTGTARARGYRVTRLPRGARGDPCHPHRGPPNPHHRKTALISSPTTPAPRDRAITCVSGICSDGICLPWPLPGPNRSSRSSAPGSHEEFAHPADVGARRLGIYRHGRCLGATLGVRVAHDRQACCARHRDSAWRGSHKSTASVRPSATWSMPIVVTAGGLQRSLRCHCRCGLCRPATLVAPDT